MINLSLVNRNTVNHRIGIFAFAKGVDTDGKDSTFILSKDPVISGCNPFCWVAAHTDALGYCLNMGHEFNDDIEARSEAKYAAFGYQCKSIRFDTLELKFVEFKTISKARDLDMEYNYDR